MNRYKKMFKALAIKQEGAFIPFTLVGYPNRCDFLKSIDTLIAAGADALELGLPFSDPVADGPVIQAANVHVLNQGLKRQTCFNLIKVISEKYPSVPIGLLVYGNLVISQGKTSFYSAAKKAGVDSVLIADVPSREISPFIHSANITGIETVLIAPPNASEITLETVSTMGAGYTYVLGRTGITGTHQSAKIPSIDYIQTLEDHNAPPLVGGFGFSNPEGVRAALDAGLKGIICGSAIIKHIPKSGLSDKENDFLFSFCKAMKQATLKPQENQDEKRKFKAA